MNCQNRRSFIKTAGSGIFGLSLPVYISTSALFPIEVDEYLVYVGTYTTGASEGIYIYKLNLSSGTLRHIGTTGGVVNPSFLALHPEKPYLYAVNEVDNFAETSGGGLSAFEIDRATGTLSLLNTQPTHGGSPCYVTVDRSGRYALVANYMGGNVAMIPINEDGKLVAATDVKQHFGSSINQLRQAEPHAHAIVVDPTNRYALATDLGTDQIMVYKLDIDTGTLISNDVPAVSVHAGAGPRHLAFSPNGKFVYVIQELDSTISVFSYDEDHATLKRLQEVSTLPHDFSGPNSCADIHISPSGRFLYGSNRGHDSIVIFAVEENTGRLTYTGLESTQGKTPRNFAIDPTGTLLLAANQQSNTIVTFWIDPDTGSLIPTGHITQVPTPVCIQLLRVNG